MLLAQLHAGGRRVGISRYLGAVGAFSLGGRFLDCKGVAKSVALFVIRNAPLCIRSHADISVQAVVLVINKKCRNEASGKPAVICTLAKSVVLVVLVDLLRHKSAGVSPYTMTKGGCHDPIRKKVAKVARDMFPGVPRSSALSGTLS